LSFEAYDPAETPLAGQVKLNPELKDCGLQDVLGLEKESRWQSDVSEQDYMAGRN
jgi:hypothetical protein